MNIYLQINMKSEFLNTEFITLNINTKVKIIIIIVKILLKDVFNTDLLNKKIKNLLENIIAFINNEE